MNKILGPVFIVLILFSITLAVIAYGRGYRFSFSQKTLNSTGLLSATSDPTGAEVFIGSKLKTATNATISLTPDWYEVKIIKNGFLPWTKKIRVQGEIVSETQAFLFPSTPTLVPLTTNGCVSPTLSPDGTKVVYTVISKAGLPAEASAKAGVYLLNLTNNLPLGFSRDPQFLTQNLSNFDFTKARFSFSPDSGQIIASSSAGFYLLNLNDNGQNSFLTSQSYINLQKDWQAQKTAKEKEKLTLLPEAFAKIATTSAKIISFSPDETKVLYEATASASLPEILTSPPPATNPTQQTRDIKKNQIYIYDIKEDKNYEISNLKSQISNLTWFPTSRHLIIAEAGKISVMEYDGTNEVTIYNGPLEKFVAAVPSGKKLLILTSYNKTDGQAAGLSNLYSINLR